MMTTKIIARPLGDTDLARAVEYDEGSPPFDVVISPDVWQFGRLAIAPFTITVTSASQQANMLAGGQATIAATNTAQPTGVA